MMSSSASCNLESQSARVQDTRTTIAFSVEMSAHSRREEAKRNITCCRATSSSVSSSFCPRSFRTWRHFQPCLNLVRLALGGGTEVREVRTVRGRGRVIPLPMARPVRASPRSTPRLNPPPCQSGSRPRRRAFGRSGAGSSLAPSVRPDAGDALIAPAALRRRGGGKEAAAVQARARTSGAGSTATAFVMVR